MRHVIFGLCIFAAACASEVPDSPMSPTSTTPSSAQTQKQNGVDLPFRGSVQAVETIRPTPPVLLVHATADGTGTHLGRFTATYEVTVTIATGAATGSFIFIAANDDRLVATFTGQGTPTAEPGVVTIRESAIITGGTGRFAGATGSFSIDRVLNQPTGASSGSFEGTISLAH
jgi:hypothetical protein